MANENGNNTPQTVSRSERTNAKNQENLHIANSIVESVGAGFNPTNPLIAKAALLEFEENSDELTQSFLTALTVEQNAVDAQIAAFKPVSKRVTLIMKAVRAQGLETEFVEGLQSSVYRLNGIRISKKTPDEETGGTGGATGGTSGASGTSSVSHRSYAGILENLRFIAAQLASKPAYNPNEPEFKSPAIATWVESLGELRDAAIEAKIATRTVRNSRNTYVYNETDGLLPRMTALKNYLGYILDKDDPRLIQMKKLKFVDNTK